jgi:vacuolar protein sorting-associated protein 26
MSLLKLGSKIGNKFGAKTEPQIVFQNEESRLKKSVRRVNGDRNEFCIFEGAEPVSGTVNILLPEGKRIEHTGIRIELIGQIEMFHDRSDSYVFTSLMQSIEPGVISDSQYLPFDFSAVEKPYESYSGINVRLRYFIRVTISRSYSSDIISERDFLVQLIQQPPTVNNSIKMEVGIEDCLHIEFEYDRARYHLKDMIIGKVYFLLVRIKIKYMEVAILRKESSGAGAGPMFNESENVTKFEIMDGVPVRGECVPLRLFLSNFDLTPSFANINNRFSVKYFLNLVLVDEEDRRYFKQHEVFLWRKQLG